MKKSIFFGLLISLLFGVSVFAQDEDQGARPRRRRSAQVRRPSSAQQPRQQQWQQKMKEMQRKLEHQNMELKETHERLMHSEEQRKELEMTRRTMHQKGNVCMAQEFRGLLGPIMIICFVVHILLAIWVYLDLQKRKTGSGIWIVIVLLTGLPGVIAYSIVRIGDVKA